MSDESQPGSQGTPAPEPKPAPATPAPAAPDPQAQPKPGETNADPAWLNPRLEQAKRAAEADLLKAYGAKDRTELDAKIKRLSELEELEPKATRAATLEQTVKQYADRELSGLSDLQRAAVTALAGDDPAAVLRAIESLKPTWGVAQAAAPAAPASPPATTSAAAPQPAPGGSESPPDHKAVFAQLRKTNPFEAARYRIEHAKDLV